MYVRYLVYGERNLMKKKPMEELIIYHYRMADDGIKLAVQKLLGLEVNNKRNSFKILKGKNSKERNMK